MQNIPSAFSRRQWLTAGAATAAGLGMLRNTVSQENNAAANVADRAADIKISGLRGFRVGTKAYIKIETNIGIVGWGEVTGLEPNVAVALAQSLFELLDGENPTRIEHLWQKIYRSHRDMRGGPFMTHVVVGDRHGAVGHHRQAVGRAGLSAARRADARQDPRLPHAQGPQRWHRRAASRSPARRQKSSGW